MSLIERHIGVIENLLTTPHVDASGSKSNHAILGAATQRAATGYDFAKRASCRVACETRSGFTGSPGIR